MIKVVKKGGDIKLRFFSIFLSLFLGACVSTSKEPVEVNQTPSSRFDLYDSQNTLPITVDSAPKTAEEAVERAKGEERLGHLDQALYLYVQALDFNSENAIVLYHIARIHSIKGNVQLAYQTYSEALAIDPLMMMAHAGLGLINMERRQHADATKNLHMAVGLDQARLAQLKTTELKEEFYQLDSDSPLRIYNALAILYDLDNSHEQARSYYELARLKAPNSALITTNLGYSYYLSGDISMAEHYLKQAVKEDPSFNRGWSNLGLVYVKKGQYLRALSTLEHIMSPADALNDLGYFLMLEGQYEQAIAFFKQAIDRSPSYFDQAQKNLKRASMEFEHRK